jgi:asparagine synthase (glutamine-hydrolysing)
VWIVYNGEVFNYPELREELISRGHSFYTTTDTEVIVHLYEEMGPALFEKLNGQFAFAIWDARKRRLLLGRDRVGIRPLFYALDGGRLQFASEIKALFADSRIHRQIDPQTLADIFTCWTPVDDRTAFTGVRQVPAGHYAEFSENGIRITPYWTIPAGGTDPGERPFEDWLEEFKALILDATRIRLRADVPVGAYLSGGIDSTYTSALVKNHFNNRLCTFSVGFSDRRFDESTFQKLAIESLQTEHRMTTCTDNSIGAIFPDVIWHTETPILRTAPAPLFLLARLVRETNFKVVLTGEGADEIMAGYNIFKEAQVRRFWARAPDSDTRPMLLQRLYPYIFSEGSDKAKRYLKSFFKKGLANTDSPLYSHLPRWHNTAQLRHFFSEALQRQIDDTAAFETRFAASLPADVMQWPALSRAQYIEMRLFLTNYLLSSQGDRMAMAHSVEGRYPFLDYRVIELAFRMPPRYRLFGLTEKHILKAAARGVIPQKLIDRPKQPYRAPISSAFVGSSPPDYVADLLSERHLEETGIFNARKIQQLRQKALQPSGRALSERENMALVGIISTQLLDEKFVRNFPPEPSRLHEDLKIYHQNAENRLN